MKPTTDADTIYHADDLWLLVHLVQDMIGRNEEGAVELSVGFSKLIELRELADELDPEYGKWR